MAPRILRRCEAPGVSFLGNHQLQDLKVPEYTHTKIWWVFAVYIPEWSRFNCTVLLPVFAFMFFEVGEWD